MAHLSSPVATGQERRDRGNVTVRVGVLLAVFTGLFMWIDAQYFTDHLFYRRNLVKFAIHFSIFMGLTGGFLTMYLSRGRLIRWLATLLVAITLGMQVSYLLITGKGFTYESAWLMLTALDSIRDTFLMYWRLCLPAIVGAIAVVLIIARQRTTQRTLRYSPLCFA